MTPQTLAAPSAVASLPSAVTMRRTLDATHLNAVANHPEVHRWIAEAQKVWQAVDLTPLVADPLNVALVTDGGGFVLHRHAVGIYEAHSLFVPEARGPVTVEAMRQAAHYMFTQTDCVDLLTRVPANNRAAAGLARLAGFEPRFVRAAAWQTEDGPVDMHYLGLTLQRWMLRSDAALAMGHVFHDVLTTAKAEAGSALPAHDDDPVHDHAVGAAVLMIHAGQVGKGVDAYNTWARLAGYQTVRLLSLHPAIVDVQDAVMTVRPNGELEILLCR